MNVGGNAENDGIDVLLPVWRSQVGGFKSHGRSWEIMGGSSNPCSVQLLDRASSFFGTTWYSIGHVYIYMRIHAYIYMYAYIYIIIYIYKYISGGQNYLLPTMDMAKVGGSLSVVKVCISILCAKIGYR